MEPPCAGFVDGLSALRRRWSRPLQVTAVTLLLLAFPGGASGRDATTSSTSGAHVYFLRGVLNVFSLGLDQIAARLRHQGISASVDNYLFWASLADQAAAEYKSGRVRTIILVGHSSGATALPDMVARLDRFGVPVSLAIGLDSVFQTRLSGRVGRYINFYIANGAGTAVEKTKYFRGALENVDVQAIPGVGHITIDKNEIIQQRVINAIESVVRSRPKQASPAWKRQRPDLGATTQSSAAAPAAATAGR
jgi:hypothetical protein